MNKSSYPLVMKIDGVLFKPLRASRQAELGPAGHILLSIGLPSILTFSLAIS